MRSPHRLVWRRVLSAAEGLSPFAHRLLWNEANLFKWGLGFALRWNAMLADAWVRDRLSRRHYRHLDESELRAARKSDTVFLFGTGSSLNEITSEEWQAFSEHDVLGFNAFHRQRNVPVDFHLLRGAVYSELRWRPFAHEVADSIASNPMYEKTILLVQEGFLAQHGNQLIGYRLLPQRRVGRYRSVGFWGPPTRCLSDGVRSAIGTLDTTINLAYALGWSKIILVGIDLYDSRHFFLPPDESTAVDSETATVRGAALDQHGLEPGATHYTVTSGIVELLREWRDVFAADGVEMSVYNPRSLLAEFLPVHPRLVGDRAAAADGP